MKLHPLRHTVVLLAAFLAGGVAMKVALGDVRMFGFLPVIGGALIGLNLRYNRRSERGPGPDRRAVRPSHPVGCAGRVRGHALCDRRVRVLRLEDRRDLRLRGYGTAFGRRSRLHRPRVRILLAFAQGLHQVWGLTTTRTENEPKSYRGNHELIQACPRPTACRECGAGPSAPCS